MTLAAVVEEQCRAELEARGFTAVSPGRFVRQVSPDVVGTVGLRQVRRKGLDLEVDPSLGVRHEGAARLLAQLRGEPLRPDTAIIGKNVGYLTRARTYRHWSFPDDERRVRKEASSVAKAVEVAAAAFYPAHSTLADILEALQSGRFGSNQTNVYPVPVCLALLGRDEDADAAASAAVEGLGDRDDGAARALRAFVERFMARPRPVPSPE